MTRQRGIDETQAEYITFLDADDILLPNAVKDWNQEIKKNSPDVIYSPFVYDGPFSGCHIKDYFWMCHGKVYKTSFLKHYDIQEDESVKCIDDGYLNWQIFDLANKVSLLTTPTYIQICTLGSVTTQPNFSKKAAVDVDKARVLAAQKISRFIKNPFERYENFYKQIKAIVSDLEKDNKIIPYCERYLRDPAFTVRF